MKLKNNSATYSVHQDCEILIVLCQELIDNNSNPLATKRSLYHILHIQHQFPVDVLINIGAWVVSILQAFKWNTTFLLLHLYFDVWIFINARNDF